jgi:hypothetical protein
MSDSFNPTPDAEQLMFGAIPGKPALGRSCAHEVAIVLAIQITRNTWG